MVIWNVRQVKPGSYRLKWMEETAAYLITPVHAGRECVHLILWLRFSSYNTGRSEGGKRTPALCRLRAMCPHCEGVSWWDVVLIPLEGAPPPPPPPHPHPQLLFPFLPSLPPGPILPHFIAPLNADNWWQMDCAAHCASVAPGDGGGSRGREGEQRRKGAGSPCSSKAPGTGGWKSIQIRPLIGPDSARAVECGNPLSATHS